MPCECGCGETTLIATRTRGNLGMVKGQPLRFIQGHQNYLRVGQTLKETRWIAEDRGFDTPCHVWQLALNGGGRYGCEWDYGQQRMVAAHILAFERAHGPVPEGHELDHLCRVTLCVNVAHLEPVTHTENVRRGKRGRQGAFNHEKTHCPASHPYSGDNLMLERTKRGVTRRCRICRNERAARYRAKQ